MKKSNQDKKSETTVRLPAISWISNEYHNTWMLITELEVNRKVLLGAEPGEKTSGERKATMHRSIGEKLFPEIFKLNPKVLSERIRAKIDDLLHTYRDKVKLLNTTGAGIASADGVHQYAESYIGPNGPDGTTSQGANNIWEEICSVFPFFPRLHRLLSSKPNMRPPAITTGVGPHGRQVVHLRVQAPLTKKPVDSVDLTANSSVDFNVIDPSLRALDVSSQPHSQETSPLDSPDSSQPISDWSLSNGYQDSEPALSQVASQIITTTPSPSPVVKHRLPLSLSFSMNSDSSPSISTQFPADSDFGNDKENKSSLKALDTPSKSRAKYTDPLLASAIASAEKKIGPAVNKKRTTVTLEDSILTIHSENMRQLRDKVAADLVARQEETALKRRKICLQEQEIIDRQLHSLRQDLKDGLIEREDYQQQAQVLRARSNQLYSSSHSDST